MKLITRLSIRSAAMLCLVMLAGCVGTIIETTTDAALAVAKAPFKAGGAVVDVIASDDE